jgi:hypothetical protein
MLCLSYHSFLLKRCGALWETRIFVFGVLIFGFENAFICIVVDSYLRDARFWSL